MGSAGEAVSRGSELGMLRWDLLNPCMTVRSSTARQEETSASLELQRSVTDVGLGLSIYIGTHRSPHIGVTTRPTRMFLGAERAVVGSTITVLPGETGTFAGNFSQTRYSCLGSRVTAWQSFTVPSLSGCWGPDYREMQLRSSRNCSHSGLLLLQETSSQYLSWDFIFCRMHLITLLPIINSSLCPGTTRVGTTNLNP